MATRTLLIYTCERCKMEFSGRNKRKGRILCPKCTIIEYEARAHGMTYGQWVAEMHEK